ncbi:MAG: methyl-accepting chemotaxis protein, partial [Nitrospirae bacterium]
LDAKVPRVGGGEVGRLEAAFNSAVWSLKGRIEQGADDKYRRQREIRALEKALERLRSGDLQVQLEGSTVALKRVQAIFNLTVSELRAFLESLKQGAEETSDRARSLSAGAREAVLKTNESRIHADHLKRQLEELLAHIESALKAVAGEQEALAFLASITETGEGSVMQVVTDLYEKADEGARQVAHKVHGLAQQGMEIGKLTELIAEVAGQTNLLALNAALEASRAGEQGRGFAAVADEIRKLAVKITETAAEIQVMVETVTEDTGGALALIENTGSELSGNKVMVEAALASFKDLVESAKSARTHARAVEERLAAIEKDARDMHGATRQLGERASGATQALDAMADDLGVVTRIAEESVKRLKRLQLEAPDGGTPPEAAPEATGTTEATARRRAARAG